MHHTSVSAFSEINAKSYHGPLVNPPQGLIEDMEQPVTAWFEYLVLELLATGNPSLHPITYLQTRHWVVHFTCEDNFQTDPAIPDIDLENGLNIVHLFT